MEDHFIDYRSSLLFRVARKAELPGKADAEQENDPPERVIFKDGWLLASVMSAARSSQTWKGFLAD
jgi:hypothetical protein